jgi:anaerobic magnesium-protoporphyrin IX monomethyl ester cyclase
MGAESGSQKVLDAMDKGTRVEQIYEATRLLKKHHIHVALFLQLGYPEETIDDIQLTIKMVEDLLPDDLGISVSYPLPGTGFYEKVKDQLKHKSNWTDSDDLDLMFSGTYKKTFYKELQRYIHSRYRIRKLSDSLKTTGGPALRQRFRLLKSRLQCRLQKHRLRSIEPGLSIQES